MFPAGRNPVSPVISVVFYGCSSSKMARPESFLISSVKTEKFLLCQEVEIIAPADHSPLLQTDTIYCPFSP